MTCARTFAFRGFGEIERSLLLDEVRAAVERLEQRGRDRDCALGHRYLGTLGLTDAPREAESRVVACMPALGVGATDPHHPAEPVSQHLSLSMLVLLIPHTIFGLQRGLRYFSTKARRCRRGERAASSHRDPTRVGEH